MPASYRNEFRDDVVAVARGREPGVLLKQIAEDFGISESLLSNWMKAVDVEELARPGVTQDAAEELRELRRREMLLEQENEVLRRAAACLSQANLKLGGSGDCSSTRLVAYVAPGRLLAASGQDRYRVSCAVIGSGYQRWTAAVARNLWAMRGQIAQAET